MRWMVPENQASWATVQTQTPKVGKDHDHSNSEEVGSESLCLMGAATAWEALSAGCPATLLLVNLC